LSPAATRTRSLIPNYAEKDLVKLPVVDQDNGNGYSLNGYSTSGGGYHAMLDEKKTLFQRVMKRF